VGGDYDARMATRQDRAYRWDEVIDGKERRVCEERRDKLAKATPLGDELDRLSFELLAMLAFGVRWRCNNR